MADLRCSGQNSSRKIGGSSKVSFLSCSKCSKPFSLQCFTPGVEKFFKVLGQFVEFVNSTPAISVTCEECRGAAPQSTDDRLDALEKQIRDLSDSMKNGLSTLSDFTASAVIGDGNEDPGTSVPKSVWATKTNSLAAVIGSSVKNCVTEVLSEESHKKNVVVSGIPEPPSNISMQQQYEQDKTAINEILEVMGLPGLEPKIYRLNRGKTVPDTVPRLMKLEFSSHGEQQQFLKEKAGLFNSEKWKKVYVRPSLPLAARRAELLIRKQARNLNVELHGENVKEKLEEATAKFGTRTIYGVLRVVKFTRDSVEDLWPKKGKIIDDVESPQISLN